MQEVIDRTNTRKIQYAFILSPMLFMFYLMAYNGLGLADVPALAFRQLKFITNV
jgi:hypothetical protein